MFNFNSFAVKFHFALKTKKQKQISFIPFTNSSRILLYVNES